MNDEKRSGVEPAGQGGSERPRRTKKPKNDDTYEYFPAVANKRSGGKPLKLSDLAYIHPPNCYYWPSGSTSSGSFILQLQSAFHRNVITPS